MLFINIYTSHVTFERRPFLQSKIPRWPAAKLTGTTTNDLLIGFSCLLGSWSFADLSMGGAMLHTRIIL